MKVVALLNAWIVGDLTNDISSTMLIKNENGFLSKFTLQMFWLTNSTSDCSYVWHFLEFIFFNEKHSLLGTYFKMPLYPPRLMKTGLEHFQEGKIVPQCRS